MTEGVAHMPPANTRLILLGTKGGPRVATGRANPANVVLVNEQPYLVDCGYGVTRQLIAAGISPSQVRAILITHYHSDHVLELGPLLHNMWVGGLREPIDVWGPPGLQEIVDGFSASMRYDIHIRIEGDGRTDLRKLVRAHEFTAPGVVFEVHGLTVSAARCNHPPVAGPE
jgi:ribonuclease BN (tRNA processing enzyme)